MTEYANNEYYDMIMCVGATDGNLAAARQLYRQRFPNRRFPSYDCFRGLVHRLHSTGTFHRSTHGGRIRTDASMQAEEEILNYIAEDPRRSTRGAAAALGVTQSSAWRALKRDRQYPYHNRSTQELTEADYRPRIEFCQWYQDRIRADPNFGRLILWSDEATFTRHGLFNHHNEHVWAHENPHASRQSSFQHRWRINLWAGIVGEYLIGPIFLPDRLNGKNYLAMLTGPLEERLEEDIPLSLYRDMVLQQDGAPAHFTRVVREYLDRRFSLWIGRGGTVAWPPRSPDLTPLDFFLWGYLKSVVYATEWDTEEQMRQVIVIAFATVTPHMLRNATRSVARRAALCMEMGGMYFEPFLERH